MAPGVGTPTLPVLRHPYRWGNDGELLYVMEDKNGDVVNTKITAHPVFLNAVRTGELDDTFHCYTFSKYKPHEGWTTFTLDAGVVFSARGISEFAGKGVVIHDAKYWNDYLRHAVDDSRETGRRFDQFGWKHDHKAFLFGDMLYTAAGPVKAVGGKIIDERKALIGPRLGGSLHGWVQAINELKLFAKDMEPYAAQVLCGFGAPLMTFVSPAEGGCALHAWSPATSTGKTTGAQGAWTIWAQEHGLALTNRDTQVGQGMMLGTLSNLPVVFDEMESRDPDWVRQFLNMLSSGRDKLRGASGGEGLRVNRATWSTIMLSTSNRSLLEIVGASDGPDAPGKRVLELEMKMIPGLDRKRGEALRRQLEANAGWAGDAFLRYLVVPGVVDVIKTMITTYYEKLHQTPGVTTADRFRIRLIACVAVAGAIVNHLDILQFNTDRIVDYLLAQVVADNEQKVMSPEDRAVFAISRFINDHVGETIKVQDAFRPGRPAIMPEYAPKGRLVARAETLTKRIYVSEYAFNKWATENDLSPGSVMRALKEAKVVVDRHRKVTLGAGTGTAGGPVPCLVVDLENPKMSGALALVKSLKAESA